MPQPSLFDDHTPPAPPAVQGGASALTLESQFDALPPDWRAIVEPFVASDAYAPLCRFVDGERAAGKAIYPADVFRALRLTHPDDVKVVILGQDPYHGEDRDIPQAHGLAFSVRMAGRRRALDRQHRVEQQHALARPCVQAAVAGRLVAEVGRDFLEDVAQRRRRPHAGRYREREPV
ncbi:uracil-DNA glycosylase family protein, partial [Burkholderia pseudomallei]|nr:hypothetical protein [Burkholderia pseudomallei]